MDSDSQNQQSRQRPPFGQPAQGPLAKVLAFILSAAFLTLAFMFSLVALAVVAVGGLMLGGWIWWKTRALRKQMQQMREAQPTRSDQVIEGEFIREAGSSDRLLR